MTLTSAALGFLGVVFLARWLLVGGDEGAHNPHAPRLPG
jgi:hypothetical protein